MSSCVYARPRMVMSACDEHLDTRLPMPMGGSKYRHILCPLSVTIVTRRGLPRFYCCHTSCGHRALEPLITGRLYERPHGLTPQLARSIRTLNTCNLSCSCKIPANSLYNLRSHGALTRGGSSALLGICPSIAKGFWKRICIRQLQITVVCASDISPGRFALPALKRVGLGTYVRLRACRR